ncbi:MAG TPA: methyltransferase domain-containing protein [Gammaproteobacteria bacterium]
MSTTPVLPAYSMNQASFPWMYERKVVPPLFHPWAEVMLDRAGISPGQSVLDVACGTGIVARLARARAGETARVVAVDVSKPMLDVAREIEPSIEWREGDAAALPVGAGERFDRVLCQQGLQFFTDRAAAARELRRVVEPGGAVLVAVWRSAPEMPPFDELQRVAERHLGVEIHDERHAFDDAEALRRLLAEAGFRDVQVETLSLTHRFPDAVEFVRMNAMALVGMSGVELREDERERVLEAIVEESAEAARPFVDGAEAVWDMRTNFAVAVP